MNSDNSSNKDEISNINIISFKDFILNINEWYQFLLTKWKFILIASIIGGAIGFTVSVFQKPIYKAELTFAIEDEKSGGGLSGALGLASSFGIDLGGGPGSVFSGPNLIALMKSRKIVEKTLLSPIQINGKIISLVDYYIEFNKLHNSWKKASSIEQIQFNLNTSRNNFTITQDSILKIIFLKISKENLTIAQTDKKISILTVLVNSTDEKFSKVFCENLVSITSEYYIEIKSKKARLNVDILQKQADSIRAELNSAITGVATASDNVYNLNPAFNVKKTPSTRRQVDVQANTAILSQLVANLELSKISLRKETPLIQVIDRPILPLDMDDVNVIKSFFLGSLLTAFLTTCYFIFTNLYKKMIA